MNESGVFRFGELTLDSGARQLLRNGEVQRLSPKAQQLLRMLIARRPRAVSREEIYDALWPQTFVSETNMAGIVSELRHVLGDDARAAQYIRTVHGFGYAFAGNVEVVRSSAAMPVAILACEGQRHLLYDGVTRIGRSHDNQIVLFGATVSRHHAIITITANTITIEDHASSNGTYVNGKRITVPAFVEHEAPLAFGAVQAVISQRISSTLPLHSPSHNRRLTPRSS